MIISKEIKDRQLYVYMNGKVIYKRWLDLGYSKVFDVTAYDKYTLTSIRELQYETTGELIQVKARLKIKTTEDGGRESGFISGYRPNMVFEYTDGQFLQTFIGDIIFNDQPTIEPGEEKVVTVRFLSNQPIEKYLNIGRKWWIYEVPKLIGEAEILEIITP
jgi:hypothetical protein